MKNITPEYKFALRDDLKDNPEFLPTKSESHATGFDVRAANPNDVIIRPFEYVIIPLGFRAFCPPGWWLELRPRSSSMIKKNLNTLYGVIDEHFTKEMAYLCQYIPSAKWGPRYDKQNFKDVTTDIILHRKPTECEPLKIEFGERIGQLVPIRRQEMIVKNISNEEYDKLIVERDSERVGGFGSTGDK